MQSIDARKYWQLKGDSYFRELSTFGALSDEAILHLLVSGRLIELHEGEHLYEAGERSESFDITLSGNVKTYMPGVDGSWTLARLHKPGDDIGFVPMIALTNRPGKAIADTDSIVLEITTSQFFDLHQNNPDAFGLILLNLVRGMARALIHSASTL